MTNHWSLIPEEKQQRNGVFGHNSCGRRSRGALEIAHLPSQRLMPPRMEWNSTDDLNVCTEIGDSGTFLKEHMNEWMNERTNEQTNKQTSKQANKIQMMPDHKSTKCVKTSPVLVAWANRNKCCLLVDGASATRGKDNASGNKKISRLTSDQAGQQHLFQDT